jgi:modulator of FtsH protease
MYDATLSRPSYRVSTNTLFAQTMTYVAGTAGLFALGAYLGRNLTGAAGLIAFIVAFVCLLAMRATASRSREGTLALLGAFGLLMGVAVSPTIVYYASADPQALWKAGGATALFISAL